MNRVTSCILREHEFDITASSNLVRKYLEKSQKQLELAAKNLERMLDTKFNYIPEPEPRVIRTFVETETSTQILIPPLSCSLSLNKIKFQPELTHRNLTINSNYTVRVNTQDGNWAAALLTPSLFRRDSKMSTFRFKVNNAVNSCLMFGVCQVTPNFKAGDNNIYSVIQRGAFMYVGSTSIWLGEAEGHR